MMKFPFRNVSFFLIIFHFVSTHFVLSRDLPPWHKVGAKCGIWGKPKSISKGRTHYIVFPNNWGVKKGTKPLAQVDVQTDYSILGIPTYLQVNKGLPKTKIIKGKKLWKKTPETISFSMEDYTSPRAYVLKADHDVRARVTITWTAPNDEKFSYSYWSLSRALLDSEYYCSAQPENSENDDGTVGQIIIVNSEWGNTIVSVLLPPLTEGQPELQVEHENSLSQLKTSYTNNGLIDGIVVPNNGYASIQATSGDLTGARIRGDNIVAVWCGNGPVTGRVANNREASLEQMIPTKVYGSWFIAPVVKSPEIFDTNIQYFKAISKFPDTRIRVAGRIVTIAEAGGSTILPIESARPGLGTKASIFIEATKPILLTQHIETVSNQDSRSLDKRALIQIPPTNRWDKRYFFKTPADITNYTIYALTRLPLRASVIVNGHPDPNMKWSDYIDDVPQDPKETIFASFSVGKLNLNPNSVYEVKSAKAGESVGLVYLEAIRNRRTGEIESISGGPVAMSLPRRQCYPCLGSACDWRDNDCDGRNNEEICDKKDNDGDGLVDEDCCLFAPPATIEPGSLTSAQIGGIVAGSILGAGMLGGIIALAIG